MTLSRQLKAFMHSLALDLNVPDHVVEDMFRSQFDFVQEKMKGASKDKVRYPIIILRGFGKFIPRREKLLLRDDYTTDENGYLIKKEV